VDPHGAGPVRAEFNRDGGRFAATLWADAIEPAGAEVLARYVTGGLAGVPALTRYRYGEGVVTYLGTRPDPAAMRRIVMDAADEAGARPVISGLPAGVEACRRSGPRGDQPDRSRARCRGAYARHRADPARWRSRAPAREPGVTGAGGADRFRYR